MAEPNTTLPSRKAKYAFAPYFHTLATVHVGTSGDIQINGSTSRFFRVPIFPPTVSRWYYLLFWKGTNTGIVNDWSPRSCLSPCCEHPGLSAHGASPNSQGGVRLSGRRRGR